MPPRRPSSAAATKRSQERPSTGCRRSASKSQIDRTGDRFAATRPATAPTGSSSRRPSLGGVSKEAGSRLPSRARCAAEDVLFKDVGAMNSAAYLARGTDFICSNFTAPRSKPTGCGLVRSTSLPTIDNPKAIGQNVPAPRADSFRTSGKPGGKVREDQTIQSLADALNLPKESMKAAYDIFKRHAEVSPEKSLVHDGRLTTDRFAAVLRELTGSKHHQDLPYELVNVEFQRAGQDSRAALDFSDFAIWFSSRSFFEHLNLDASQRSLRRLARKHNMPYPDVEKYKQSFDEFDIDRNGAIHQDEFQHLLYKLSKVPERIGLPLERVQQLWSNADANKSGELNFEEFLIFYKKYFDKKSGGGAGFEDYYRSIRRCSIPMHS